MVIIKENEKIEHKTFSSPKDLSNWVNHNKHKIEVVSISQSTIPMGLDISFVLWYKIKT